MNKLNVWALLLVVAAGSQLLAAAEEPAAEGLKASDKEEVAALEQKSEALSFFCLSVRDYVTSSMKDKTLPLRSAVAGIFSSTKDQLRHYAQQLTGEASLRRVDELVAEGQKSLGERLAQAPLRPSSLLSGARKALGKASSYVVEGQRALGRRLQESPVEPAAVFNAAHSALGQASGALRRGMSSARDASVRAMGDTCKLMADYEREIERRFEALKLDYEVLAEVSLDEVKCITIAGINGMLKACREKLE